MLRQDSPLWLTQQIAKSRGDFLVPDRWVEIVTSGYRQSPWLLLVIPIQVILAFPLCLLMGILPEEDH